MCCVCVHTHTQMQTMEYCSAIKKELNNAFRSNMDRPRDIILSEVSQTEKGKYPMISPVCGIYS